MNARRQASTQTRPDAQSHVAYLALGANLGDRLNNLRAACSLLERGGLTVARRSAVFETDAVVETPLEQQPDEQPPYLNAVVRIRTELTPHALLALALDVERALGRERTGQRRWAARTLDIDLLLYDEVTMVTPSLVLPHPRLLERAFVRVPLSEVADVHLRHPVTGHRLDEASSTVGVRRFAQPL